MSIPFTQFLRPDGTQREMLIDRPADIERKARYIVECGLKFQIETLNTGGVYMECYNPISDTTVTNHICENDERVLCGVDRLINQAYSWLILEGQEFQDL